MEQLRKLVKMGDGYLQRSPVGDEILFFEIMLDLLEI